MFVYGLKRCREGEGYGTTLSELYEYEKHRDVSLFLEPFLKVAKEPLTWGGLELHQQETNEKDKHFGEPTKNEEKINNVRMRRVWSLVLQLLYDDEEQDAPVDESHDNCKFEDSNEVECSMRWGAGAPGSDEATPEGWKMLFDPATEMTSTPIDIHYDRTLRSVYELVKQTTEKDGGVAADLLANQELMIWAVLFNRFELAEYFWQEGGCAIPNALLASRLLYGLAERDELDAGSLADVVAKMGEMSEHFEQAAIGVLTVCYTENSDLAQDVLQAELDNYDWMGFGVRGEKVKFNNSMELAFLARNMNFIEHPACQAVVDRLWKGGRSHDEKRSQDGKRIATPESYWKIFTKKMSSPAWKFYMDALQYAVLLVLQSYCVLQNLKVEKPGDMVVEHVLAFWYLALIFEEVRSMFDDGWSKVFLTRWWNDYWNKLDVAMYILFVITYGMRLTFARQQAGYDTWNYRLSDIAGVAANPAPDAARMNSLNSSHGVGGKGMYGLICLIMYMRAFQYLSNNEGLGPKILVLGQLVKALMQYLVLLALFIVAFGIFMEGLANPSFSLDGNANGGGWGYQDWSKTVHNVLYRPYFQMYGELMMEDISSETRCIGHTPFTGCSTGFEAIALPLAIAIYMIVTSLMILNMLIADFTLTFERSLETASRTFKMNKYDLLQQYDSKPPMPVPLSLPYVGIYRFICNMPVIFSIVRSWFGCPKAVDGKWTAPTADENEKNHKVEDFQDRCCDTYLLDVARSERENVDARVARIEAEVTEAKQALQFFKGKTFTNLAKRNVAVNAVKVTTAEYPTYTVSDTLTALKSETACMLLPTIDSDRDIMRRKLIQAQVEKGAAMSNVIIRGATAQGSWAPGSLEGQRCSFYQVVARDTETDLDKCECRKADCVLENPSCRYRQKGGSVSATVNNPFGNPFVDEPAVGEQTAFRKFRTETLGSFPNVSGENKMMLHVVTRWKRDENGMTIDRGGRNLLEFVAFKRTREDDMWSIPAIPEGQLRNRTNSNSAQVDRIDFDSAVNQYAFTAKNFKDSVSQTQQKFVQEQVDQLFYVPHDAKSKSQNSKGVQAKQDTYPFNGKTIYSGFMDDERTTTAAWLSVKVVIHHDERGFSDAYSLNTSKATDVAYTRAPDSRTMPPAEIAWLTLHRDLDLFGEEEDLLQHVAKVHGAYW